MLISELPDTPVDVYLWRRVSPFCREYNSFITESSFE